MSAQTGLFGGSFDPIHHGHLITARAAAELAGLERVILLPSACPPHKPTYRLTEPGHRVEMIRRAIADEPLFEVSDFDTRRSGPTYTIETVEHFRAELGNHAELAWMIGTDSLAELHTWHRVAELVACCDILTLARPGFSTLDWRPLESVVGTELASKLRAGVLTTPAVDVSSTEIRARLRAGKSVRYLVPDAVAAYIDAEHLYQG